MGKEKTFEEKIKDFLKNEGAWFVKYFANRNTRSGIPDILACVNGYFVAIEVKADTGKSSPLQIYHCTAIREAGGFAFILYPSGFETFKQFIHDLKLDEFNKDIDLTLK